MMAITVGTLHPFVHTAWRARYQEAQEFQLQATHIQPTVTTYKHT